jgi:molybdate transport system permease protein
MTSEEWSALRLSLQVAALSTIVGLLPAIAIAQLLARGRFAGKALLDCCVHLPLVLPPVAVGYFLLLLLGRSGPLGRWLEETFGLHLAFTWQGAALASAIMAFPLMVRSIRLAIELVDRRLEDAARTLGAGPLRAWWTVTLPLARPGIIAGLILGFARSLGEFGATITFAGNIPNQTRTLPLAMYTWTQVPGQGERAVRLMAISIVLSLGALLISEWLTRRTRAKIS